jgi:hypothetical protein
LAIPKDEAGKHNVVLESSFPSFTYPFEALLRAVETMQQTPSLSILESTDVLSNAGNLTELFRLVRNSPGRLIQRLEVDVIGNGNTLAFSRWDQDPQLWRRHGYGVWFEHETCWHDEDEDEVVKRSASHHRVMSYSFGGLRCLIQAEVDGFYCACGKWGHPKFSEDKMDVDLDIPSPPPSLWRSRRFSSLSSSSGQSCPSPRPSLASSPPSSRFSVLSLDDPGDSPSVKPIAPVTNPSPTLAIHHTGRRVPSRCLVEVKTKNIGTFSLDTYEEQLYFARRAQLYVAGHARGVFFPDKSGKNVQKRGCDYGNSGMREWECRMQRTLKTMVALLMAIKERVAALKEKGETKLSLICENDGTGSDAGWRVRICRREDGRERQLVPPDLI